MLDIDPTQWDWQAPAREPTSGANKKVPPRRPIRTILLVVTFAAWALAGAAAATTIGLPLARIGALSTPVALACGVGAHLAWSALVATRTLFRRWGLLMALLLAGVGAEIGRASCRERV